MVHHDKYTVFQMNIFYLDPAVSTFNALPCTTVEQLSENDF